MFVWKFLLFLCLEDSYLTNQRTLTKVCLEDNKQLFVIELAFESKESVSQSSQRVVKSSENRRGEE